MTPKQIEQTYKRLINRQTKLSQEIKSFREEIKNTCTHSITRSYNVDHDDGYGKWWTVRKIVCELCGKEL